MPGINEIVSALIGSWRIVLRDVRALDYFEHSIAAFWRSFTVFLLAAPLYLMAVSAQWRLTAEAGMPVPDDFFLYALIELTAYAVTWAAFPLAMLYAARALGLTAHYVSYIIVYNWSSLLIVGLTAPLYGLYNIGVIDASGIIITSLFILVAELWYRWQMASMIFKSRPVIIATILMLDVVTNVLVKSIFSNFHPGSL